jgi:hypothetical protein
VIGPTIISSFGVRKFSDAGLLDVAALEHLVEVHLGHAARGVAGVVVAHRVDHHAVEHGLHLDLDLIEQLLQLARLDEGRDVVVGMEALAGRLDALADLHGHGGAGFVQGTVEGVVGFHEHAK